MAVDQQGTICLLTTSDTPRFLRLQRAVRRPVCAEATAGEQRDHLRMYWRSAVLDMGVENEGVNSEGQPGGEEKKKAQASAGIHFERATAQSSSVFSL